MSDRTFLGAWQKAIEAKAADAPRWMSRDGALMWAKSEVNKANPGLAKAVADEANHNARALKAQRKGALDAQEKASKW